MATSVSDAPLQQMRDILRAYGVTRAAFFGSFARGTANERSDVDILVEFAHPTSLLDLAALEVHLSDLMGRSVEIVTYRALNPLIREKVLREQVNIL